jgi:hypothetical protein
MVKLCFVDPLEKACYTDTKITVKAEGRAAEASKWCTASGQQNKNFVDLSGG